MVSNTQRMRHKRLEMVSNTLRMRHTRLKEAVRNTEDETRGWRW